MPAVLTVATANVNGIRAAYRRGMGAWLDRAAPDVLCLQEVRATDDVLCAHLGDGWHCAHSEPTHDGTRGRAGVAVASRLPVTAVRDVVGPAEFTGAGRWVEADVVTAAGEPLTVVSVYVHTGEAGTPRQQQKMAFLDAMLARMAELRLDGRHVLVCGDLNIAHREADLKNWRGNLTRSGFLPDERALLDRLFGELGWVDVVRAHVTATRGDVAGPYSWWSWRGKAFDNDAGWRIDYQVATPELAKRAQDAWVDRAPSYAERWSDHAPVLVRYDV
ncbi:MAG: exodeoxyribonuclease III [Actinomycetota bacterium]